MRLAWVLFTVSTAWKPGQKKNGSQQQTVGGEYIRYSTPRKKDNVQTLIWLLLPRIEILDISDKMLYSLRLEMLFTVQHSAISRDQVVNGSTAACSWTESAEESSIGLYQLTSGGVHGLLLSIGNRCE